MVKNIEHLIGIPYKTHGRDFNGCDCWGLAYLFHEKAIPEYGDTYESADDIDNVGLAYDSNSQDGTWVKVEQAEAVYGDIICFNIRGVTCHVGVYLGEDMMIHTLRGHNSAIEHIAGFKWSSRIEGFYRCNKN